MNNIAISDKMLRVTINLRDNTTKEISEGVGNGSGDNINLKSLSQNISSIQTKVNDFLTQLVEQESVTSQSSGVANDKQELEDDDDDEDDDEDAEDGLQEPPVKQQKR